MCFALAFGRCPSQSSLGSGRRPCGQHTRNTSHEANITRARLHLALLEQLIAALSSVTAEMVLPPPIARLRRSLRLWVPPTPSDARSRGHPCCLAASRQPTGIASPGSARVVHLPALFHAGSSMGTRPSEVSPRSTPAFSPSLRSLVWMRFHQSSMPFPAFEDDLPVSPQALLPGLLSWASIVCARLPSPCGSGEAHTYVRSSECQRSGSTGPLTRALLRGVRASATQSHEN
jgi:hypothetical protein